MKVIISISRESHQLLSCRAKNRLIIYSRIDDIAAGYMRLIFFHLFNCSDNGLDLLS